MGALTGAQTRAQTGDQLAAQSGARTGTPAGAHVGPQIEQPAPLILVHGFLSDHRTWDDVTESFANDRLVIAPDLPGFGESEKPPSSRYSYSLDSFAESLVDLIAALKIGRASLCGHDLGGAVALLTAARYPQIVDRLIVVSPSVYRPRDAKLEAALHLPFVGSLLMKQVLGRRIFRRLFHEQMYAAGFKANAERLDSLYEHFNLPAAREAAHSTLLAMQDQRALLASIPRVMAPTLVVWGRGDSRHPLEYGRKLTRALTHAELEVLECGHSPHEEMAADFEKLARAFLTSSGG